MGRPELFRSGQVSIGDKSSSNDVDDKENQSTDTIGPVPDANQDGHQGDDHPDKPVAKFAERYPADAAGDDEQGDVTDTPDDDSTRR